MFYDKNGAIVADFDRKTSLPKGTITTCGAIKNNLLTLPEIIQFTNGNQIVHDYDAMGNRQMTTFVPFPINRTVVE